MYYFLSTFSTTSATFSIKFVTTDGAPVLRLKPGFDAGNVEFVEASQGHDELVLNKFHHANAALTFTVVFCILLLVGLVASSGQLRQNFYPDRLLAVAHVQLIHVVLELLLAHVVYSFV